MEAMEQYHSNHDDASVMMVKTVKWLWLGNRNLGVSGNGDL